MSEVVRFETGVGSPVLVEVGDDAFGVETLPPTRHVLDIQQ